MNKEQLVEKYYNKLNSELLDEGVLSGLKDILISGGKAVGRGAKRAGGAVAGGALGAGAALGTALLNPAVLPSAIGAATGTYVLDQFLDFGKELIGASRRGKGEVQTSKQQQIDLAKQFAKGDRTALFAAGGIGRTYEERQRSKGETRRLAAQLAQDELRAAKKEALTTGPKQEGIVADVQRALGLSNSSAQQYQKAKAAYYAKSKEIEAAVKARGGKDVILDRDKVEAAEMKALHQKMKAAEKAALAGSERYQAARTGAEVTAPIFQSSTTVTERPRNSDLGMKRNATGQYVMTSTYVNPNSPEGRIKAQAEAQEAESRRYGPINQDEARTQARANTREMEAKIRAEITAEQKARMAAIDNTPNLLKRPDEERKKRSQSSGGGGGGILDMQPIGESRINKYINLLRE